MEIEAKAGRPHGSKAPLLTHRALRHDCMDAGSVAGRENKVGVRTRWPVIREPHSELVMLLRSAW